METRYLNDFFKSTEAVTSIEYALLGALIAAAIASSFALTSDQVVALWTKVANCVNQASNGNAHCF